MWRGAMFYCGDRKGFLELFNPFPIYRVNCKSNFSIRLRVKSGDRELRLLTTTLIIGSNPITKYQLRWLEHLTVNQNVVGSSLTVSAFL